MLRRSCAQALRNCSAKPQGQWLSPRARRFLTTRSHAIEQISRPAVAGLRSFHSAQARSISLTEDAGKDTVKESEPHHPVSEPTPISNEEFHARSDAFIEALLEKLEIMQEDKPEMDVEYSAGVLNVVFPPAGTYVLNKQPPNKQIWLSSPISGPYRFDWVVVGESMHQKEGAGSGMWVYLRDGTTLSDVLRKEMAIGMDPDDV